MKRPRRPRKDRRQRNDENDPPDQPASRERSARTLIAELKAGTLTSASLSHRDRRACVECLTLEWLSVPEIAEVLGLSERTVLRHRAEIRKDNALDVDPDFSRELLGQMLWQGEAIATRLRRISRDRNTEARDRIDIELGCWRVAKDIVQLLQSTGHVSSVGSPGMGSSPTGSSSQELLDEIDRVRRLGGLSPLSPATLGLPPPNSSPPSSKPKGKHGPKA